MEMKKIACAVIFAAACLSAVLAADPANPTVVPAKGAATPEPATVTTATPTVTDGASPAPGPSSGAADLGSLVGATILSFVAYYMHF